MKYLSVCSGIEAATVAWHPLGWSPVAFSEIEPFPCAVLAHHYPSVPNLGDMTAIADKVLAGEVEAPDVLVGGTPCQAFSIAGLRNSLDDARGQLSLEYIRLLNGIDTARFLRGEPAAIAVWENVPGVLNTKDNAFGCFLAGLAGEDEPLIPSGGKWTNAGCVYGPKRAVAWRVLDAQYFGVAQRRRRVFVVASARNGFNPAAVLFEFYSLRRDLAPSRQARQSVTHDIAPCLTSSGRGVERGGDTRGQDPVVAVRWPAEIASTLNAAFGSKLGLENQHINSGAPLFVPTLTSNGEAHSGFRDEHGLVAAFKGGQGSAAGGIGYSEHVAPTLSATDSGSNRTPTLMNGAQVRRLTPIECERLQGFPDSYTLVPHRGKPAADGPRYKALGNSMAVPCMAWIGKRIDMVCGVKP